jgi:hypothetical protein
MSSIPLNFLCWSLLCGPWSSFVVSFPLGPYSRFPLALVSGPMLASILWFPMAHPLVPNGPSSGSLWPILWFPMARPLIPYGPSSGSQWPILRFPMEHPLVFNGPSSGPPPPPGYLSRVPYSVLVHGSSPSCLLSYF